MTGATTPLGRSLVARLAETSGVEVVLASGVDPSFDAPTSGAARVIYARADLTRNREVRNLLFGTARALGIDTIIHASHHRRATDGGERIHALNVEATRDLLHLAERHASIVRFVLVSSAAVYMVRGKYPSVIDEDHPLELSPGAPQWVRDRVEADLVACTRMGMSPLGIAVLRFAECLAPACGSQLFDYLSSRVCFTPLGFDPMVNLISPGDFVTAAVAGASSKAQGIFNIPGKDTLPLSGLIARWGAVEVPIPGSALGPLYRWRAKLRHTDFRYDLNAWRFHFGSVLDGRRAAAILGYRPAVSTIWPGTGSGRGAAVVS